jgi:hypothetical protein
LGSRTIRRHQIELVVAVRVISTAQSLEVSKFTQVLLESCEQHQSAQSPHDAGRAVLNRCRMACWMQMVPLQDTQQADLAVASKRRPPLSVPPACAQGITHYTLHLTLPLRTPVIFYKKTKPLETRCYIL